VSTMMLEKVWLENINDDTRVREITWVR